MHQHSSSFYGGPFHGKWIISGKLRILCPYCQVNQGRKEYSRGDSSAALLASRKDSYEIWTFNCLACSTKKRLVLLLQDLGWMGSHKSSLIGLVRAVCSLHTCPNFECFFIF